MMVYLIKTCDVENFKKLAKQEVKVQEIEICTKTSNVYIERNKTKAIEDCRKYNRKYKECFHLIYYFTEIKLH